MLIYIIIYLLVFVFSCFDLFISGRRKVVTFSLLFIIGFILILVAGLRWETGTDWGTYRYYFVTIETRTLGGTGMELGYEMIVRSFKLIFGDEQTPFLFFIASFIVFFTYSTLYEHSPFPLFSLFLLMSYSLVASGFGVRQDMAIALSLFSLNYIEKRSLGSFILINLFAFAIHKSSIIFFPAYFIFTFRWTTLKILGILVVVIVCVAFSDTLMLTFGSMIAENKTDIYMEMGMDKVQDPITTLIKGLSGRFLIMLIGIAFVKYTDDRDDFFNGIFNIYVFGIVIYAIFSPINLIFSRLARPYDIFQVLLVPLAYAKAPRLYKIIILVLIFSFSILKFSTVMRGDEEVYIPYKTVFNQ